MNISKFLYNLIINAGTISLKHFKTSSFVLRPRINNVCLVFSINLGARFSKIRLVRWFLGFLYRTAIYSQKEEWARWSQWHSEYKFIHTFKTWDKINGKFVYLHYSLNNTHGYNIFTIKTSIQLIIEGKILIKNNFFKNFIKIARCFGSLTNERNIKQVVCFFIASICIPFTRMWAVLFWTFADVIKN